MSRAQTLLSGLVFVVLGASLGAQAVPPSHPAGGGAQTGGTATPGDAGGHTHPTGPAGGHYNGPGDTAPGRLPGGGPGPNGSGPGSTGPGRTGPGSTEPPLTGTPTGRPTTQPHTPSSATDPIPDFASWETWWVLNREYYLDVKRALYATGAPVVDDQGRTRNASLKPDPNVVAARVAPALLLVLAEETNPELLSAALIALARIDGPETANDGRTSTMPAMEGNIDAKLTEFLAHPQLSVSESAVLALGIRARSAMTLTALLDDTPRGRQLVARDAVPMRTRAFAAFSLGLVADRATSEDVRRYVVHELAAALAADPSPTREIAVACVSALGLARLDSRGGTLAESSGSPPSSSREALCAYLLTLLLDNSEQDVVRAHVPAALARLCDGASEDLRLACLRAVLSATSRAADRVAVRQGAVLALGRLARPSDTAADRDAREALPLLARDGDRVVRGFALLSAGEIGGAARQPEQRTGALDAQRILLGELARGHSGSPGFAAIGLGVLGARSALIAAAEGNQALRAALAAGGSQMDLAACGLALGLRQDKGAQELVLERAVRDGDDHARAPHVLALGLMGARDAHDALRAIADHSLYRPIVLRDASIALMMLGDRELSPLLASLLRSTRSLTVQTSVAEALGAIGDARNVDVLIALAREKSANPLSKAQAVRALGQVADLDLLPWNTPYKHDCDYAAPTETLNVVLELR